MLVDFLLIYVCYVLRLTFFFSSRRRHTRCALVTGVQTCALPIYAAPDALGSIADPSRAIARAATRFKRAGAPCARGRVRTRFACRRAYGAVWPYPAFTGNRPPMILE